jgi:hypothetical protein
MTSNHTGTTHNAAYHIFCYDALMGMHVHELEATKQRNFVAPPPPSCVYRTVPYRIVPYRTVR